MEVVLFPTFSTLEMGSNCVWTFSDGTVINGCDTISAVFVNPGCYSVTFSLESADGCAVSGFGEDVFCVIENPEASFSFNPLHLTYISPEVSFTNYGTRWSLYMENKS